MTGGTDWALILAGGDGTRLQAFTRRVTGQPIPKQYCRLLDGRSLLEATIARVQEVMPAERTLAIVNENHLAVAGEQLERVPPANRIIQPRNRDTGPGLLLALLELERRCPEATLAVFPSDHYIANRAAFAASVARMRAAHATAPDRIVLLGIRPSRADTGLGYIVPGPSAGAGGGLTVTGFEEKPAPARAAAIIARGALWSSFIMVFRVRRMLDIVRAVRPQDVAALARLGPAPAAAAYGALPAWNLSRDVLARRAGDLLAVPADDLGWSDWGTPRAIAETVAALGLTAPWLSAAAAELCA